MAVFFDISNIENKEVGGGHYCFTLCQVASFLSVECDGGRVGDLSPWDTYGRTHTQRMCLEQGILTVGFVLGS